jgi:hypothetical protein
VVGRRRLHVVDVVRLNCRGDGGRGPRQVHRSQLGSPRRLRVPRRYGCCGPVVVRESSRFLSRLSLLAASGAAGGEVRREEGVGNRRHCPAYLWVDLNCCGHGRGSLPLSDYNGRFRRRRLRDPHGLHGAGRVLPRQGQAGGAAVLRRGRRRAHRFAGGLKAAPEEGVT